MTLDKGWQFVFVNDCMRPERIVVGTDNDDVVELLRELYEPFNRNHDRMIMMDIRSAELTKYAALHTWSALRCGYPS